LSWYRAVMVMLADKDVGNEAKYKTAKEWWYM
jgi:hypothetical protein